MICDIIQRSSRRLARPRWVVPTAGDDLAIALGILAASGQLPMEALDSYEFIGELALNGELRPVDGVLPTAIVPPLKAAITP
mgnify:CR=1 FL=1